MTITTKYSINDEVWVMDEGKPFKLKVKKVNVEIDKWHFSGGQSESYFLANGITAFCHHEWYKASKIYPTKEALIASL